MKDKVKLKKKFKDQLIEKPGMARPLSKQAFDVMDKEDKEALAEMLTEQGIDYDNYEKTMKKLFPREVGKQEITWDRR